jgi:hypothetical protein
MDKFWRRNIPDRPACGLLKECFPPSSLDLLGLDPDSSMFPIAISGVVISGSIGSRIGQTIDNRNVFEWNSSKRESNRTRRRHNCHCSLIISCIFQSESDYQRPVLCLTHFPNELLTKRGNRSGFTEGGVWSINIISSLVGRI